MKATLRAFLERADFEVLETTVRYYTGTASAEELGEMAERLRELQELAADLEQTNNTLFEFPRGAEAAPVAVGH